MTKRSFFMIKQSKNLGNKKLIVNILWISMLITVNNYGKTD